MSSSDQAAIDLMEEILATKDQIESYQKKISESRELLNQLIGLLKKDHPEFQGGLATKTGYKGKYYSMRSKFDKKTNLATHFLCESRVPFASWRKTKETDPSDSAE